MHMNIASTLRALLDPSFTTAVFQPFEIKTVWFRNLLKYLPWLIINVQLTSWEAQFPSRSMAQAIFFLEDNFDVYINVLLLFKSICNVKLQTDYFTGRKGSLEVCAGLRVILLGFGKARRDQQCEFAGQILLFSHTHTPHQFCKAGTKNTQTVTVFIFSV